MVTNVTSLSGNGVYDWLIQRVTAVFLLCYLFFLVGYFELCAPVNYEHWKILFDQQWMKAFTSLALLSVLAHAWVGMWTITTDYLNSHNLGDLSVWIRLPVQIICVLILLGYLFWGANIIWGL